MRSAIAVAVAVGDALELEYNYVKQRAITRAARWRAAQAAAATIGACA